MAIAASGALRIPGPSPSPVLGYRGNIVRFFLDPIAFLQTLYHDYGKIAALTHNNPTWLAAFGPEYNQQILSHADTFLISPLPVSAPPGTALNRLTSGLVFMNGPIHRQQRRLMMPAFHKKYIDSYRDDIVAITQRMLDSWQIGQHLNIAREMQKLTLQIATKSFFGVDVREQAGNIGTLMHGWIQMATSPAVLMFQKDLPGTPYRALQRLSQRIETQIRALIASKRADPSEQLDVLATLINTRDEDGSSMTDDQLIGHAHVLFEAGHETTASALTWTLFLLAQHPKILADLRDELAGVLRGAPPTVEHLAQLPLLERVVKESMRVLTPVVFMMRLTAEPCTLGPYRLPQGARVIYSQYISHRLPELYSEPATFRPDRWLSIEPNGYEYIPFGAGPHVCIGAAFAMMELRMVLAMILQRYGLELEQGARIDRQVQLTLAAKRGVPMQVIPRDRAPQQAEVRGNIRELVDLPG
jgi:cytochrome P450